MKDVSKWELKDEMLRQAQDIISDPESAMEMMLPKETKKVEYLSEESAYFTNQCWKESRRTVMLDYAMGREHFVDMGEQMHRHIYEINLAWGNMLDFYTDLNNARKEKDDNYAEQNHIGEEIIEPDEPTMTNKAQYDSAKPQEKVREFPEDNVEECGLMEEDSGNMLSALRTELDNEAIIEQ